MSATAMTKNVYPPSQAAEDQPAADLSIVADFLKNAEEESWYCAENLHEENLWIADIQRGERAKIQLKKLTLSVDEEASLQNTVKRAKKAATQLIKKYAPLRRAGIARWSNTVGKGGVTPEDLDSIASLAILTAAKRWQPRTNEKGTTRFSAHAKRAVNGAFHNQLRYNNRRNLYWEPFPQSEQSDTNDQPLDYLSCTPVFGSAPALISEELERQEIYAVMKDGIETVLSDLEKRVIEETYNLSGFNLEVFLTGKEISLKKMAALEGMSPPGLCRARKRALNKLRAHIKDHFQQDDFTPEHRPPAQIQPAL